MEESRGLDRLNAWQLAGLAAALSTAVAVIVFIYVRRTAEVVPIGRPDHGRRDAFSNRSASESRPPKPAGVPRHFSEDLIVPGVTQTGDQIARDDATQGWSPEGV
jgi:hypothetical protein